METASELITEAEKERARKVLDKLCAELSVSLSIAEGKTTARAVYHDAVTAAAKVVANSISEESEPIAIEIVTAMLKDSSQHAFIQEAVLAACKPVARHGALTAIRRWSEEKAIPKAEEAASKIFRAQMESDEHITMNTAVLAGLRASLQNSISNNPELTDTERQKLVDDYIDVEGRKAASEALLKGISAELRRKSQSCAERAIEEVASQATDQIAREEALDAARVVAGDTARAEISRLILAEVQRRAAKLARERMQEEALKIDEDKRAEYCQAEAKRVADEAVKAVAEEIADPAVAQLDLQKAHELALSAANAVAREFSGAYNLHIGDETNAISKQTVAFLVAQITLGMFIVWFFLLGGYEVCRSPLERILPASVYQAIYRSVPTYNQHKQSNDIDELLDDVDSGAVTNTGAPSSVKDTDSGKEPDASGGMTVPEGTTTVPAAGTSSAPSSKALPAVPSEEAKSKAETSTKSAGQGPEEQPK